MSVAGNCTEKRCGQECNAPCPKDQSCMTVMYYCQTDGKCDTNAKPECGTKHVEEFDPCKSKECGDECASPCDEGQPCPTAMYYCQQDGSCGANADLKDCKGAFEPIYSVIFLVLTIILFLH